MNADIRKILVLGASGLIGRVVTDDLRGRGFSRGGCRPQTVRVAESRRARSRTACHVDGSGDAGAAAARSPHRCRRQLPRRAAGRPRQRHDAVHCDFVARLLQAIRDSDRAIRLVHIFDSRHDETDRTAFSTTKREAERLIAESGVAFTILRPGFVVALAAYGGSAMVRSLAAYPFDLPAAERARAIPADRHGGHCRDHRLACGARSF